MCSLCLMVELQQLRVGTPNMLRCYLLCFFGGSGDHGAAGKMVGFAKEPAGALMNGGYRLFGKG
jgi:hypothetical protein